MDKILEGLDHVFCYLDDVLIAGKNLEDCRKKLLVVLERLAKYNIKVNLNKCQFFVSELPYLGHILTGKGLKPNPEKVKTIQEAKTPTNINELKAFLGLINYYNKFLPNLSSTLCCLYNLLKKDVKFIWTASCENVFQLQLLKSEVLTYYDSTKLIVICTDASSYGLGGVISHIIDGTEKPIWFTSFSLNSAQKAYPILHLEALAIVSTIKKFHKFLFGQNRKWIIA